MAFQTLSTRARGGEKTKIEVADVKIAVCVFAFDLMYVDGEALVKESFRERRKRMREAFPNHSDGHFEFAREVTVSARAIQFASVNVPGEGRVTRLSKFDARRDMQSASRR
jgi:ATP-dependent DNA ligase